MNWKNTCIVDIQSSCWDKYLKTKKSSRNQSKDNQATPLTEPKRNDELPNEAIPNLLKVYESFVKNHQFPRSIFSL